MQQPFHSIYTHNFIRAAVCILFLRIADPAFNVERTIGLARWVKCKERMSFRILR
jgi:NAD+ synthase (glutamine-hydrolysing)